MTPGTSPRPWGNLAMRWAAAVGAARGLAARLAARAGDLPLDGTRLARVAAALYLAGLCIVLTTAWHDPAMGPSGATFGLPSWHLAFLLVTGAAATLLTLARGATDDGAERAIEASGAANTGLNELMAQMNHELRTPLNAVIGFSEVMQHELHGPLGNARYQEYAHHISESGGRLLKSSEEALAITELMTALMADRRRGKRERLVAGTLVRDAWRAATRVGANADTLKVIKCNTCVIVSERRPVAQALEHLLREASSRAPTGVAVQVVGRSRAGKRILEIGVAGEADTARPTLPLSRPDAGYGADVAGGNMGVILARLLLETQRAALTCTLGEHGAWMAVIEFPANA
jgi:signal transduction histidine kinase